MNSYSVYLHITPSKKVYVGITSQTNINRRWQNGEGYRTQKRFYRAIQKYGWENIEHRILFSGLTKQEAEEKEIQLISQFDSTSCEHGYNCENGGNCTGTHSEETKRKISVAQLGEKNHMYGKHSWCYGKKHSPEHIEKNRLSHMGQPSYWKGKQLPEETKAKMRKPKTEEHKRKLSEARSVPVICIETGEVFSSGKAAGDAMGISRGSIARVVKGERNTAGGYHWKLA